MNKEIQQYILLSIYRWTNFPINARGIIWLVNNNNEVEGVTVKGNRKTYTIKYNFGTDLFDCKDSKRDLDGLYLDQITDFIQEAK